MKNAFILFAILFSSASFAQVGTGMKYANPKSLYLECELAVIYGNTNDSWGMTISGLTAAFWDNDSYSIGKYKGIGYDNTIGTSDRSYGDGRFFVYEGVNKKDKWSLIIGPTYLLENNQIDSRTPFIYGTLKVPGKMKSQLMECKVTTKAQAQETIKNALED